MEKKNNPFLLPIARTLRRNMTPEENHLWYDYLQKCGTKWYRQRVVGKYVADFYCAKAKLIIELDGSQHYQADAMEYDAARTQYLQQFGIMVYRVPNYLIWDNFAGVCKMIEMMVKERTSPSTSSSASPPPLHR